MFRRALAVLALAPALPLLTTPPATADVQSANMQPEVQTRPDGTLRVAGLDAPGARAVFCDLKETGADHVTLTWPLEQATRTSTTITARTARPEWNRVGTMTDTQIRTAIRNARSCGLKVVLKPHLEVDDNTWRGRIGAGAWRKDDRTADRWQRSWTSWLVRYAKIARTEKGVDQLVIGTEQWGTVCNARAGATLNRHNGARWAKTARKVKSELRKTSQGRKVHVVYAAHTSYESRCLPTTFTKELWRVDLTWYPARDVASSEVADLRVAMLKDRKKYFDPLHKRTGKKVQFAEVGFASLRFDRRFTPRTELTAVDVDQVRQANLYTAAFQVIDSMPYVDGVMIYRVGNTPDAGGPQDPWLNVQGKLAERVVAREFGGHVPGRR